MTGSTFSYECQWAVTEFDADTSGRVTQVRLSLCILLDMIRTGFASFVADNRSYNHPLYTIGFYSG